MSQIRFTRGPNFPPTIEMSGQTYVVQCVPASAQGANLGNSRVVKTAAATLLPEESGALCLFNLAAGFTFTLPTAAKGLWFEFQVTVSVTSSTAKLITASASEFLLGHFVQSTDGTFTQAFHAANGSTIRAWNGNGSTTGGLVGDWFRVVGLSATQWAIIGWGSATGTEATPFATS